MPVNCQAHFRLCVFLMHVFLMHVMEHAVGYPGMPELLLHRFLDAKRGDVR